MKYRLIIKSSYIRISFLYEDLQELGKILDSLNKTLEAPKAKDEKVSFTIEIVTQEKENE